MYRFMMFAVLAIAGCSKGDSKSATGESPMVKRWTELKTKMCACTDAACGDKVMDEYRATDFKNDEAMTKEYVDAMEKLQGEFHACRDKLKAGK
jgi:hypothetical protein